MSFSPLSLDQRMGSHTHPRSGGVPPPLRQLDSPQPHSRTRSVQGPLWAPSLESWLSTTERAFTNELAMAYSKSVFRRKRLMRLLPVSAT